MLVILAMATLITTTRRSAAAFTDQTTSDVNTFVAASAFFPTGLSHFWQLDGDAIDSVGGADGTVTGTSTVDGNSGSALAFDEVDDVVVIPDLVYTRDTSVRFDFKIDDNSGTLFQYIYSHGDPNDTNSINIFVNEASHGTDPNVLRTVVRDGNDSLDNFALQTDVANLVGDGLWHTYVLVMTELNGTEVYIDGDIRATDPTRGTYGLNPAGDLFVGNKVTNELDRFYGSELDTLQIYDRGLSAIEVAALSG